MNNWVYDKYVVGISIELSKVVVFFMWVCNILLVEGYIVVEMEICIFVCVSKEYEDFVVIGDNGGKLMYFWSMDDIQIVKGNIECLVSVFDLINVVLNLYYVYFEYECIRLDNVVKIMNFFDKCIINIYMISGKFICMFKKDNFVFLQDWDLKNMKGILIVFGVYIIYVDVLGVGEKIVKFFGGVCQVDFENI